MGTCLGNLCYDKQVKKNRTDGREGGYVNMDKKGKLIAIIVCACVGGLILCLCIGAGAAFVAAAVLGRTSGGLNRETGDAIDRRLEEYAEAAQRAYDSEDPDLFGDWDPDEIIREAERNTQENQPSADEQAGQPDNGGQTQGSSQTGSQGGVTLSMEEGASALSYAKAEVQSLDVEVKMGQITIVQSDSDAIEISATGAAEAVLTAQVLWDGTLQIQDHTPLSVRQRYLPNRAAELLHLTIALPADGSYQKVELEADAAEISVGQEITADEIDISLDAGTLRGESLLTAIREMDLETNAGEIVLDQIQVGTLSIECTAGNVTAAGSVAGNLEVDSDVGNVELTLAGALGQYNYEIESTAGSISVAGETYSGKQRINNQSPFTMELEAAAGSISVEFAE